MIGFILLFASTRVYAQVADTSVSLLDSVSVRVKANNIQNSIFLKDLVKSNPHQNFSEILQKQTGIFIRSNGVSSLSTLSYKGLGTMHLPIYIDGKNIQSSMNGTMDLSLLDAIHFSNSSFVESPNSSVGTSNIGTGINLKPTSYAPSFTISTGFSSLLAKSISGRYSNISNNIKYAISALGLQSANRVSLSPYGINQYQQNGDITKTSIYQSIENLHNKNGHWKNSIYFQMSERGIPQGLINISKSRQFDLNLMMSNNYSFFFKNGWFFSAKNQLWKERIDFDSKQSEISRSDVLNVNTSLLLQKRMTYKFTLIAGIGNQNAWYNSNVIVNSAKWNRLKLFYAVKHKSKKREIDFKHQLQFDKKIWMSAKLKLKQALNKNNVVEVLAQKVYRLPTLNELYWYEPGFAMGNPDLKAEDGYRLDGYYNLYLNAVDLKLNIFGGIYQNFVAWQGFPVIMPINITGVLTRGMEINTTYKAKKILVRGNVQWVKSTYNPSSKNDDIYGMQLIYTPSFTSNITSCYRGKALSIYVNEQIVGNNYYTSDNSAFIKPYFITEIGGSYQLNKIRFGGVVSNVFNTPYFNVPNMPMPGAVFKLNINYTANLNPWKEK